MRNGRKRAGGHEPPRPITKLDLKKPVKVAASSNPRSKSEFFSTIAQQVGIHRRDVAAVFHVMGSMISLPPRFETPRIVNLSHRMGLWSQLPPDLRAHLADMAPLDPNVRYPRESGPLLLNSLLAPSTDAPLWIVAVVHRLTAYYVSGPSSERTVKSHLVFADDPTCGSLGGLFAPPDRCCIPGAYTGLVAPAVTFDLSTLGLVPPFHVEGP